MILCNCTGISEKAYKEGCHLKNAPDEILYAGMFCGTCKEYCDEIKKEIIKIQKEQKNDNNRIKKETITVATSKT